MDSDFEDQEENKKKKDLIVFPDYKSCLTLLSDEEMALQYHKKEQSRKISVDSREITVKRDRLQYFFENMDLIPDTSAG